MPRRVALLAGSLLIVASALPNAVGGSPKPELAVAAAANLIDVFQVVGVEFEEATGIHPVFSFGSTARLAHQIENGAPWDVFAGADTVHLQELDTRGLLTPGSRATYATGILALWLPSVSTAASRVEDLANASVRVIAIAKPELAPYGLAARESLEHAGIWQTVAPKVVYAENISMAKQYGATGNADAVFTAYALVKSESTGRVIQIPESMHQPIRQALGIIGASKNQALARQFRDFLLTGEGHKILLRYGYR
jgi:molybdate transport system substrate-binding protein